MDAALSEYKFDKIYEVLCEISEHLGVIADSMVDAVYAEEVEEEEAH